jgi:hypothetical protein
MPFQRGKLNAACDGPACVCASFGVYNTRLCIMHVHEKTFLGTEKKEKENACHAGYVRT